MRKFQNTDYVRNKYSKGILYKVSDELYRSYIRTVFKGKFR